MLLGSVALILAGGEKLPREGALFLLGGGSMQDEVLEGLARVAGGTDVTVVLVPTAYCWSEDFTEGSPQSSQYVERLTGFGFTNVEVLHTRSRELADTEGFVEPLSRARVVFFSGGCPECLTDAYLGTRFHRDLQGFLSAGGVVAGSSAGAEAMGLFVEERCEGAPVKGPGFGLTDRAYIGVHVDTRPDLLESMKSAVDDDFPTLVGIGIEEGTAVVIRGSTLEVVGSGAVVVYQGGSARQEAHAALTRLEAGDTYTLPK
jgi:cyanophycinase